MGIVVEMPSIFRLIMVGFFLWVPLYSMDPVKKASESAGNAAQSAAAPQEYADFLSERLANIPVRLALSQDEFESFTLLIKALNNVCILLEPFAKKTSLTHEQLMQLSFAENVLIKNVVRLLIFFKMHGIPARREVEFAPHLHWGEKKLDNHSIDCFKRLWQTFFVNEGGKLFKSKKNLIVSSMQVMALRKGLDDIPRDKIIDAICADDLPRLKMLLAQGQCDINRGDALSYIPVMYAVIFNFSDHVQELLAHGALIHCIDQNGLVLPMLINKGLKKPKDERTMRHLVRHFSPNFFDLNAGVTPLMRAAEKGSVPITTLLLQYGADVTAVAQDGVKTAYGCARDESIRKLLGPQARAFEEKHRASVSVEQTKKVQLLMQEGQATACQNSQDKPKNNLQVLKADDHGIDLMIRLKAFDNAPHDEISLQGEIQEVDALRIRFVNDEHGKAMHRVYSFFQERNISREGMKTVLIDINPVLARLLDTLFDTIATRKPYPQDAQQKEVERLVDAVRSGDVKLVKELLEKSPSSMNGFDLYGYSPLYYAVMGSNRDLVQAMIDKKGDVNLKNEQGAIPLLFAWDPSVRDLLYKAGARLDFKDKNQETPLATALKKGSQLSLLVAKAIGELEKEYALSQNPMDKAFGTALHRLRPPLKNANSASGSGSLGSMAQDKTAAFAQIVAQKKKQAQDKLLDSKSRDEEANKLVDDKKLKKQQARDRAEQEKIAAEKKKKEDARARQIRRENYERERNLQADKAEELRQKELADQAREQSLMHHEDMKMLALRRVIARQQNKQRMALALKTWKQYVKHENERLAALEKIRKEERLKAGCASLANWAQRRVLTEKSIALAKMGLFACEAIRKEKQEQERLAQKKRNEQEALAHADWSRYRLTGKKSPAQMSEDKRQEQLKRRRSQLPVPAPKSKLNPLAPEFVLKK